tara:strand:+ start:2920 stop:3912 length:993 start_codon:yes stop_codon:yes gene_type:complete
MSQRSENNNRTYPLDASGGEFDSVFTGLAEETGDFTAISVSVVVPTVCLLTIEQSFDKVNWYFTEQFTVEPNTHRTFQQCIVLEYFRVVLANQGILQTFCHMISSRSQNLTQNVNIRNLTTARDAVVVDTSGTALSVDVSGGLVVNFPAVQDISGSVSVLNFPAVQDISGSVTIPHLDKTLDSVDISGQSVIVPHLNKTLDSVDISGQTLITNRTTSSVTTFETPALASNLTDLTILSQQIKASPGSLMNITAYNSGNATSYVKIYDASGATSSDTPVMTFPIRHDTSLATISTHNFVFSTAIAVRATSGYAANDNTSPNGSTSIVAFYT